MCKVNKTNVSNLEDLMKKRSMDTEMTEEGIIAERKIAYSKVDVIKLDTKCLYAGKLERIKQWREKQHSHPFCEILFVFSGSGESIVDGKSYPIQK